MLKKKIKVNNFFLDEQNYLLNFNNCFFYDKLFQLVLAFIFVYYFGYFIFELLKKRHQKKKLKNFFLFMIRNMAKKEENTSVIENKLDKVEINDNLEKKFLHDLEMKLSATFGDCKVSLMIR